MIAKRNLSKFQMNKFSIIAWRWQAFLQAAALGHFVFLVWRVICNEATNNIGRYKGKFEGREGRRYLDLFSNKLKFHVIQKTFPNHSMKSDS